MKIITTLLHLSGAVCVLGFAGAVVGGSFGLMLAAFGLLELQHLPWPMAVCAALFVAWAVLASDDSESTELLEARYPEPRKPKLQACSIELFDDDDPFIEKHFIGSSWHH